YKIICCFDVCDPVANRFVYRVLQGSATRFNRMHRCAKQLHSKNIQILPLDILCTHIHLGRKPKCGTRKSGAYTMLTCPGLGNYPLFAHPPCQERLTMSVVSLVCTSMQKVLPL